MYISRSTDPFINLALEHLLFETIRRPALFLYQNAPCVVIGRAQNPWVEANLPFLNENTIPLLRRQSGGGAVFHDLGNLNFTFFSDKNTYDKSLNLSLIMQALQDLNAPVEMNERHDLILQGKKISGSAYREKKDRVFHHATLLIDSNLEHLRKSLQAPQRHIISKGVPSVRSSVINLKEVYPSLRMETIQASIFHSFGKHYSLNTSPQILSEAAFAENKIFKTARALYQSDVWRFEKNLPFTETLSDGSVLHVENGRITHMDSPNPDLLKWKDQLYSEFYLNPEAK